MTHVATRHPQIASRGTHFLAQCSAPRNDISGKIRVHKMIIVKWSWKQKPAPYIYWIYWLYYNRAGVRRLQADHRSIINIFNLRYNIMYFFAYMLRVHDYSTKFSARAAHIWEKLKTNQTKSRCSWCRATQPFLDMLSHSFRFVIMGPFCATLCCISNWLAYH